MHLYKHCENNAKTLYNAKEVKYNNPIKYIPRQKPVGERMVIMKKVLAIILTVVMLLCFAACQQENPPVTAPQDTSPSDNPVSDLAYIQNKGKLVVGITDYAPMDYKDANGEWIGFDAEFAKLFAQELNVDIEFFVIGDWSKKFVELETKNIDVIWNGMTISQDVLNNTSCSDPYVYNAQVVVMKADVAANYTDTESLKGLTIACEEGSVAEEALEAIGITDYIVVENQEAALLEVKAGTSEACVVDVTMARAMTGEGTNYDTLAQAITLTEEEYGVGFRKDSDVTEKLNAFMAKLMADGTLDALAAKYELTLVKNS